MKYTLKEYDLVMEEIIKVLKQTKIELSNKNIDGRINSIHNENEVIDILLNIQDQLSLFKKWNLKIYKQPKSRYWYDLLIKDDKNNFYCPINIKITNLNNSSADNISSKEGLYFSLTGIINDNCPINWGQYFSLLSKNIKENDSDYFFLVFDKNDSNEVFYSSMKRLTKLTPNGNNPPFQCKWSENKIKVNRTFDESKNFLIDALARTIKKRAQILEEFNSAFNEYRITIK